MLFEEVADLGEEHFLVGGSRRGGFSFGFGFLEFHDHAEGDEDRERDDEEVDDVLDLST